MGVSFNFSGCVFSLRHIFKAVKSSSIYCVIDYLCIYRLFFCTYALKLCFSENFYSSLASDNWNPGLFNKAILMSGSGSCQWSVQPHPLEVARDLAEDLGCDSPPGEAFLECLKKKSVQELIEQQNERHVSRGLYIEEINNFLSTRLYSLFFFKSWNISHLRP